MALSYTLLLFYPPPPEKKTWCLFDRRNEDAGNRTEAVRSQCGLAKSQSLHWTNRVVMGTDGIKNITKFWKEHMALIFLYTFPRGEGKHVLISTFGRQCVPLALRACRLSLLSVEKLLGIKLITMQTVVRCRRTLAAKVVCRSVS
jgi:hypothetical protein